jgi:hypothetical protein
MSIGPLQHVDRWKAATWRCGRPLRPAAGPAAASIEDDSTARKIASTARWLRDTPPSLRPTAIVVYGDAETFPFWPPRVLSDCVSGGPFHRHVFHGSGRGEDPETGAPLTTFVLPEYAMGREAVSMLLQKIAQPSRPLPCRALPSVLRVGPRALPPAGASETRRECRECRGCRKYTKKYNHGGLK